MKTERELFEEAFKKVNSGVSFWLNTWSDEDNDYGHLTASWGWHMWQASANRQGYKLVPIEPTRDMLLQIETSSGFNFEIPCGYENIGITAETARDIYRAMIGACHDH